MVKEVQNDNDPIFCFCEIGGWSWNYINYISKKELSLAGPHPQGKRAGLANVVIQGWVWTQEQT